MGAEHIIPAGQVDSGLGVEVAEGGREAVAAMLARHAAERAAAHAYRRCQGKGGVETPHRILITPFVIC